MPYPPQHRARTRKEIVRSARKLFNRHGFGGVSIDEIMAAAGLTRGGFYSYFASKGELYAEAVTHILSDHPAERWEGASIDFGAGDAARQVVRAYLSRQHFDDVDGSCPMVALPSDVARADREVKRAFETVLKVMLEVLDQGVRGNGDNDRRRALAIAALCVGGMVIARGIEDRTLADELRDAALATALTLGGWR
jgi:AcrR family transcriptional regulator